MRASAGVLAAATVTALAGLCSPALGASSNATSASARSKSSAAAASSAGLDQLVSDEAVPPADANSPAANLPAATLPVRSAAPAVVGQWSAPFTPGNSVTAVHMVLMDTGKVLEWTMHYVKLPGDSYQSLQAIASVYDPVTKKAKRVDPPIDNNIFCSYATTLSNGDVLVVGGIDPDNGYSGQGVPIVLIFDPVAMTWTVAPSMNQGRWYPSVIHLADGRDVAIGGHLGGKRNAPNYDVEAFPATGIGPQVVAQYKVGAGEDMYPSEFQLPNGQIFSIVSKATNYIDPVTWKITNGPALVAHQYTYPNGTILPITPGGDFQIQLTGGRSGGPQTSWGATTTSERIDMSSSTTPAWQAKKPLPQPRTNTNTVLLPDGTLLMVGGNQSGNFGLGTYQALQYIPSTDTWNVMAAQTKRRAYHSTAVLMPDGTVLSGGDNGGGVGGGAALETYSPPYMFSTARPKITAAPTTATRGTAITVNTSVAVQTLELIAPGAATHATDLEQRVVQLASTATTPTSYVATLPADNTLPPGPYMLFAVDTHGVPSVATWVMVS
ncbi:MAG TPA: galactose oxidase-like domain-containing protein [Acidimicrobiia bacterium]|jgi:hypothetical protein